MMSVSKRIVTCVCGFVCVLNAAAGQAVAADDLYAAPSASQVRSQIVIWVASRGIEDKRTNLAIATLWADDADKPSASELLDRVIATFSLADADTKRFVQACRLAGAPLVAPDASHLYGEEVDAFYSANMMLFYARYLTQRRMFDEALDVFNRIDAHHVIDPAACHYFKAVCQHQLLLKSEGLETIKLLLKNTEGVPIRYSRVATLMQYELEQLREKSVGEISRKMKDSQRRLELARGGQRVRKVQDEIITDLDEIIKKLEAQAGGGGGSGSDNRSNRSGSAANKSIIKGKTAPGKVNERSFRNEAGWGSLPPKQQAKASNLINLNYPAHYKKAIDEYFKRQSKRRAISGR